VAAHAICRLRTFLGRRHGGIDLLSAFSAARRVSSGLRSLPRRLTMPVGSEFAGRKRWHSMASAVVVETDIPARLDRLPSTRFPPLIVAAPGFTWLLGGLGVTLAGSIAGALQKSPVLRFGPAEVGLVGTAYLIGAVTGAVLFGYLTDRFGRKKLFFVTLGLYL